jgi:hypothetical protein
MNEFSIHSGRLRKGADAKFHCAVADVTVLHGERNGLSDGRLQAVKIKYFMAKSRTGLYEIKN